MNEGGSARVRLLGPVEVQIDGRLLGPADLGGRKPKQLLEILLVHLGQAVPKERIAELLWGDRLPVEPMRTLEAYVSGLRAHLHSRPDEARRLVRSQPGAYVFGLDGVDVDLRQFDELTMLADSLPAGERAAVRQRALELVRGDLLADEPYTEWLLPLRNLYAERVLLLRLDLAEDLLAASRPRDAVALIEQVLVAEPSRERAHRLLVAGQYLAGEQDRALASYERCREVLDDELGVQPLAETERVFLAVLNQEPPESVLARRPVAVTAVRRPEVRFAHNGEATIAYQCVGDGPVDVIFAHAWFSHAEVSWEEPHYAAYLHRLARGRRLLIFDRRGMGMSDPAPPEVTLDERVGDILAVMDDAGSRRATVFGSCGAGPLAIAVAAKAPDRISGLMLFGTYPRMLAAADYPAGWSEAFYTAYVDGLERGWLTGRGVVRSVPSVGPDESLMEWLARLLRLSVSPAGARAILQFGRTLDVRDLLGRIEVPTLVLHRVEDQWIHPDNGRYLAGHIPGAEYVELPGADHWPWFGDAESVIRPIEGFLGRIGSEGFPRVPTAQ